jgi:hypothetical protein
MNLIGSFDLPRKRADLNELLQPLETEVESYVK